MPSAAQQQGLYHYRRAEASSSPGTRIFHHHYGALTGAASNTDGRYLYMRAPPRLPDFWHSSSNTDAGRHQRVIAAPKSGT